ncbi:MAG: DinB family protein [Acidimicrobiales bacterium]
MRERSAEVGLLVDILSQTPGRLHCSSRPRRTAPSGGEWSAVEVVSHLRCCADVWGGAIATILNRDESVLRARNPLTWAHTTDYLRRSYRDNCESFAGQRAALLEQLGTLTPHQWSQHITVTGAGAPRERSVTDYVRRLALHERSHWRQVARLVGAG